MNELQNDINRWLKCNNRTSRHNSRGVRYSDNKRSIMWLIPHFKPVGLSNLSATALLLIIHVPMTITEAQKLVASEVLWTAGEDIRYKFGVYESAYGGIQQRGVLFHSTEQQKSVDAKFRTHLKI